MIYRYPISILYEQYISIMSNKLISNLEKLHTTEAGMKRIKKNLQIKMDDIIGHCIEIIKNAGNIMRTGKNWYVYNNNTILTINACTYTIITAHIIESKK